MIKANIPTSVGTFQIEGTTQAELFRGIATVQGLVPDRVCGLCGSENIRYSVRDVDDNSYYEVGCMKCGAALKFGQNKSPKGGLFIHRKLDSNGKPDFKNGTYGEHRGWTKYRGGEGP